MSDQRVELKKVAPQTVAAVRDVIPAYRHINRLFAEVYAYLGQHGVQPTGPGLAVYYDAEYKERDADVEAAVPVAKEMPGSQRVRVRELPGIQSAASVVHEGPYSTLSKAYSALTAWVRSNGYRIAGPNREVFIRGPGQGVDEASYLTEVQYPVEKA